MSPTTCAGKLVMFAAILTIVTVVCGQCPAKCHCSKYKMFCSLAGLNSLPTRVENATHLVRIELDNITQINSTKGLENLTRLVLVRIQLKEIHPGAFQSMFRIEYLAITYNAIGVLKTNSFKYLDNLHFLNLSKNYITRLEPGTFSGLVNLRTLDLSGNNILFLKAEAFEGMRYNELDPAEYGYLNFSPNVEPTIQKYLSTLTYFNLGNIYFPSHVTFGLRLFERKYIEYVNRNNKGGLSQLLYLHMVECKFLNPESTKFQNFSKLVHLELSHNDIWEINSGYFESLVSLRTLKINYNKIFFLHNGTFRGLQSLKTLDISICEIRIIERDAFEGLSKLRLLDLSWNRLHHLNDYTFTGLRMLKELKLDGNEIAYIHNMAFSNLSYLKKLSNTAPIIYPLTDLKNETHKIKKFKCPNLSYVTNQKTFLNLQRIDNLDLSMRIRIPQDIQMLKTLHFYIDGRYVNPRKELSGLLQILQYVRDFNVTLVHVNSTQIFTTFFEFRISKLLVMCSKLEFLDGSHFTGLSMLKSLTISDVYNTTIQEGTFQEMKSLIQLTLFYKFNLTYKRGSFSGLQNLRHLSILSFQVWDNYVRQKSKTIKCLDKSVFIGLDNLTKLKLRRNTLKCLHPGAFQGLRKIEEIDLSLNKIEKIESGVFGALCKNNFEISCKNVTLPEYCNATGALTTLKYLNLFDNNISHIHPHAFVSCTNLQILNLSFNRFLTLDKPFLFTPALRKLVMTWCNIVNIPNSTFQCTPLLSEIDLHKNKRMTTITTSTVSPLQGLQKIDLSDAPLTCNCHLRETWIWLRQHRVHYKIACNGTKHGVFSMKATQAQLSNMNCSNEDSKTSSPKNRTSNFHDFAFFKQYIEPIVLIIILTFGLACNGFLLFVSLRHPDMRTKQNACVIHLAAVDILSLLLNLPLSYWDVVNIRWEFDETLCKIFLFSKDVMVGVNVYSIVALGVERLLVARNFKNLKKICKSKSQPTAWLLMMTWISGIIISLPAYFSAVVEVRCLYCPPGYQDYIRNVWTFQLIMYCVLPTVAIAFLNIKTSLFLKESIRNIPGEIRDNIRAKNRNTVANIVLILVIVFVISYFPSYILRVLVAWSVVDMNDVFLPSFFTFCLFFCNTMFNPISLFIMSSKYKLYAFNYFQFLKNIQTSRPIPVLDKRNFNGKKVTPGNYNYGFS